MVNCERNFWYCSFSISSWCFCCSHFNFEMPPTWWESFSYMDQILCFKFSLISLIFSFTRETDRKNEMSQKLSNLQKLTKTPTLPSQNGYFVCISLKNIYYCSTLGSTYFCVIFSRESKSVKIVRKLKKQNPNLSNQVIFDVFEAWALACSSDGITTSSWGKTYEKSSYCWIRLSQIIRFILLKNVYKILMNC